MPHITIKTGFLDMDGREEQLSEYFCDVPGCPNVATEALGGVRELGVVHAVCQMHVQNPRFQDE